MPSYRTIIDQLTQISPDSRASEIVTAGLRLLPQGEAASDPECISAALESDARAWATRLAFESLRGWHWPYWMNAALNPASPLAINAMHQPLLVNTVARDALPLVEPQTARFAGTMDRRGMITPPGAHFSIEVWCRIGNDVVYPSCIFDESQIEYKSMGSGHTVKIEAAGHQLTIAVQPVSLDGFEYLNIDASLSVLTNSPARADTQPASSAVYIALRPYDLDGITRLHDLVYNSKGFWMSDNRIIAWFPHRPDIAWASDAKNGDAALFLFAPPERTAVRCATGMTTATNAFHMPLDDVQKDVVNIIVPLRPAYPREFPFHLFAAPGGSSSKRKSTIAPVTPPPATTDDKDPDLMLERTSLAQLTAATDVTSPVIQHLLLQRNHWLVAAVRALHVSGCRAVAARLLNYLELGLTRNGYLPHSRRKWGFPGQYLTAVADYYRLANLPADDAILTYAKVKAIANWIIRKRREVSYAPNKPAGLFPPGITRNGLGREYQLADNIWGIEGLQSAAWLARQAGQHTDADDFHAEAASFARQVRMAVHRELEYAITQRAPGRLHRAFDPASAAELLDLALAHETRELLAPRDWLLQVVNDLQKPLVPGGDSSFTRMDECGISPARHIMLALLCHTFNFCDGPSLQRLQALTTPMNCWTEVLHQPSRTGRGMLHFDPEAAALYLLLARKLKTDRQ